MLNTHTMLLEKLEHLNALPAWQRIIIIASITVSYLIAFFILCPPFGHFAVILAMIPGVVTGWFFGWRGGALFGLILAGLMQVIYAVLGKNYLAQILLGSLLITATSMIVGYTSNLIRLLRRQTVQLGQENQERELIEENLRIREALFRSLFNNSPIALWEEDLSKLKIFLDERKSDGVTDLRHYFRENPNTIHKCARLVKIVRANPKALEVIATQTNHTTNLSLHDILTDEGIDGFIDELAALAEGKTYYKNQFVHWTSEGNIRHGYSYLIIPSEFQDTWKRVFIYDIDITERVKAEKIMQANANKYRDLFENVSDLLYYHDLEGNFIDTNLAFKNFGYLQSEVDLLNVRDLIPRKHRFQFNDYLQTILEEGYAQGRIKVKLKDGSIRILEYKNSLVHDEGGNPTGIRGSARDMTEQVAAENALIHMATHDPLTDLPNRTLFEDRLAHGIDHAKRYREKLAVIFLDLDDLKNINDSLGHEAGDIMIIEAGNRLHNHVRASDTLARLSGDEFTLTIRHIQTIEDVRAVVHKLQAALQPPFVINDHKFKVTASIGISLYPQDGEDALTLLRRADRAMYNAKNNGKNLYKFFHDIQE